MKYSQLVSLGFISMLFLSCGPKSETAAEKEIEHEKSGNHVELTKAQFDGIGVILEPISKKNLKDVVKASGFLKVPPQNQAHVASFFNGMIRTIEVKTGDYVTRGQSLATLEHPDVIKLQEDYATTESRLGFLEKEYQRQKTLSQENAGILKNFQQAESDYFSEKAKLKSFKAQLALLEITPDPISERQFVSAFSLRSPIDGYITNVDAAIGMMAEHSKALFDVTDNSKIHVDLLLYEKDLFKVKIGQDVDFILSNQENRPIKGKVFSLSKSFENETKSVAVHAEIKNETKLELIPGMFVTGFITVGDGNVDAVPQDAVVSSDGKEYVFVEVAEKDHGKNEESSDEKEEGHFNFAMVPVKTGTKDLGYIQITVLGDILPGARIVSKGAFFLLSKAKESEGGDHH